MHMLATVALWGAIAVPAPAADLPVVASRLVTGPASHIDLTNTSAQPVTAWTLVLITTEADGRVRQSTQTIDAYMSEITRDVAINDKVDRLMPGQTREIMLDPIPAGTTAEITAVILEDGTAIGDRDTIASLFELRAKERDQLREVVQLFDAVLPSSRGAAALEGLKRRFAASSSPEESEVHQVAREAVDAYLLHMTPANEDAIDQLIRRYADLVNREYQLAERHSHQKP
jgi:hypothetical protein